MFVLVTNWKYCWSALHSLYIYIKNNVHWQLRKEFAGFKIFYQWKMDSHEQLNCFCMSRIKKRWLPSKYIPWMVLCTNLGLEWEGKRVMKIFHESMLHNSFPKYDFSRINSRLDENVTSNESVQSSYWWFLYEFFCCVLP